jgi:uncharacterized protein YlxP (DUF503 family)
MKIELRFPPVPSIKDKRKIVNSVKMKIFSHFKIPAAEVDDQELYNSSVIGLSFVSLKKDHCVSKGQKIISFIGEHQPEYLYDHDMIVEEY